MGTEGGTGLGTEGEEKLGRLGGQTGAVTLPAGAVGRVAWVCVNGPVGGGEVVPERVMRSPSVVAERGAITFGVRVGADMGVGVENLLIS